MISSGATTVCFGPVWKSSMATRRLPRMLTSSSSAEVIIRKQSESATGDPCAMLPTSVATLRICGEPNRSVSAWISGNESWANASSRAQVTLAPTERTPPSMVIGANSLIPARLKIADGSSPCVFRSNPSSVAPAVMTAPGWRAKNDGLVELGRAKQDPVCRRDQNGLESARSQLLDHHLRRIEARQWPYFRASTDRPAARIGS